MDINTLKMYVDEEKQNLSRQKKIQIAQTKPPLFSLVGYFFLKIQYEHFDFSLPVRNLT